MKPFVYNFTIPQGASFTLPVVWKDKTTNEPVNLTGYDVKLQVRKEFSSSAVITLIDGTEADGVVIVSDEGRLTFYFSDELTAPLSGTYRYDVLLSIGENRERLMQGTINFSPRVTQP